MKELKYYGPAFSDPYQGLPAIHQHTQTVELSAIVHSLADDIRPEDATPESNIRTESDLQGRERFYSMRIVAGEYGMCTGILDIVTVLNRRVHGYGKQHRQVGEYPLSESAKVVDALIKNAKKPGHYEAMRATLKEMWN